jgi:hypothetical protein
MKKKQNLLKNVQKIGTDRQTDRDNFFVGNLSI